MSFILNALKKAESDKRQRDLPGIESYQKPYTTPWWQKLDPLKWATLGIIVANLTAITIFFIQKPATQPDARPSHSAMDFVDYQPKRFIQNIEGFDAPVATTNSIPANSNANKSVKPRPGEVLVADLEQVSISEKIQTNTASQNVTQTKPTNTFQWDSIDEFSDLPVAWQKEMPDMTFAAHVYGENQETSFIIVNGQTLYQGDQLGEITVISVHEKGAIFRMRGKTFKVKF